MKVVIEIPKSTYKDIKETHIISCGEPFTQKLIKCIKNGVELPEGAEILTKEAYSDLCMRASKVESEVENKKEKHTCISCRFYRYDRRTWPCDDCLDYDRWKEVEE